MQKSHAPLKDQASSRLYKPTPQEYQPPRRSLFSNLLMVAASAGLLVWAYQLLQARFTSVTSLDAVINGAITDVKAPREGLVDQLRLTTGAIATRNHVFATLRNDRINQLSLQEIKTRVSQQQSQLAQAQTQLTQHLALVQQVATDQQNQQQLEATGARESLDQVTSDLKGAAARYQLAKLQFDRTTALHAQGAVSQATLDASRLELEQRQAEVESLTARSRASQTAQQAAQLGLTLDKTRSNYDPRIRLQELEIQISNQRQTIQSLTQSLADAQAELAQATADLKRNQTVIVISPATGVVWRLPAQPGKYVQQGDSLGQVLDCRKRWMDVFVDEKAMRSLKPGTEATIELYGNDLPALHGRVSLIRSGVGRLAAGEEAASNSTPIAQNLPRTTQVRVELVPQAGTSNPKVFCYVGYTGKVTFKL